MCGRYSLTDFAHIQARFGLSGPTIMTEDNYNVSPGHFMPIIYKENGENKILSMKWGLIPSWAKDIKIGYKLINARDDTLLQKPMWKNLARHSRCLVPASGFYEWKIDEIGEKQPYFIHIKEFLYFTFAGLFSVWKDVEGHPIYSFTIITTDANKEMSGLHNRMPVILDKEDEDKWLDPDLDSDELISEFLHPAPDGSLKIYPVSKDVNKPKNNNPTLLDPILNSK